MSLRCMLFDHDWRYYEEVNGLWLVCERCLSIPPYPTKAEPWSKSAATRRIMAHNKLKQAEGTPAKGEGENTSEL